MQHLHFIPHPHSSIATAIEVKLFVQGSRSHCQELEKLSLTPRDVWLWSLNSSQPGMRDPLDLPSVQCIHVHARACPRLPTNGHHPCMPVPDQPLCLSSGYSAPAPVHHSRMYMPGQGCRELCGKQEKQVPRLGPHPASSISQGRQC